MILMRFIEPNLIDRDQRHSEITHLFEDSVQGSLIRYRSRKKRIAILSQHDDQSFELIHPMRVKVPFEADFVMLNDWLITHSLPCG